MLDIGFTEILLLGAVALIVLGPEKLPHAARMAGAWYGRIRRSIATIQAEIEQEVNLAEMRKRMNDELEKIRQAEQSIGSEMNSIHQNIQGEMSSLEQSIKGNAEATPTHSFVQRDFVVISQSERDALIPAAPYQHRKAIRPLHETTLTEEYKNTHD
ncbi:Sec-independent protein translocase protein TatB [Aquirhabdus parva]|uniref:Sec-independent protein translocase protein TatB n=1 Tax=Aquirhabdus parva TaxID=2283318 RepID=A0A345P2S2_9GAMM|nr:Sec-independent protein translocase protein TatB [Aquirhabdus parva]AXI01581.1 twin-arginine translocase subunit TatB [Aquirhabdus parva]